MAATECRIKNELGSITVVEDVISTVAGYAAVECIGIVAMASKRATDGLVELLGRENLKRGVRVAFGEDLVDVLRALRGVHEDEDGVVLRLGYAVRNSRAHPLRPAVLFDGEVHLTRDDSRDEVAVMREDAVLSRRRGDDEGDTLPLEKRLVGGIDAKRKGVHLPSPPLRVSAFLTASSIVPTL